MKKSNLMVGILYILLGAVCLIGALLTETKMDGILWGFAGSGIVPGLLMICQYFYWSSPKHAERYADLLENKQIEMHDELKSRIRDQAGRYTYGLGVVMLSFSMIVFGVLGALGLINNARLIILYLCGFLIVQVIAGIIIYNKLLQKY